jgi:hypothetical protein
MLPEFLIPETTIREAGAGLEISLGEKRGGVFILTLGITRIIEQQSLDISIWGSTDGNDWGAKPLLTFPQKFYCGTYQTLLDLSERPGVAFLRAKWQVNRWGRGDSKPLFTAYLFVKELQHEVVAMGA